MVAGEGEKILDNEFSSCYVKGMKKKTSPRKEEKETVLVNFKVSRRHLKMLDAKAKALTGGNRSKLLLLSALNRKTPFQAQA
jgi:ABC-type lipopolysaccharide export system ATPase subunit